MTEAAHDAAAHETPIARYVQIFAALIVLTGVTVGLSYVHLGDYGNIIVGMAVAACKATLVAMFFMHLKYEGKVILFVAIFPLLLMAIVMLALMPDVGGWGHPA